MPSIIATYCKVNDIAVRFGDSIAGS